MPVDRKPWDVEIDTTKTALERTMRALIATRSTMTDSHRTMSSMPMGRGDGAHLRVHVPKGRAAEFRDIAKPYSMRPPSRIQVGMEVHGDDRSGDEEWTWRPATDEGARRGG